jgi:hypothetical protein
MTGSATLDAGALIALDRSDDLMWSRLRAFAERNRRPTVSTVVITQAWRSPRQANLGRALALCRVEPVDERLARKAGALCGRAGTADAVDAIVVASAARRQEPVVTSDPADIALLAAHVDGVDVIPI